MKNIPAPASTWPKYLTIADYARACTEVTGRPVSRQAIHQRIKSKSLATEPQTIGGQSRPYINTETYPPPGPPSRRGRRRPTEPLPC